MTVMQRMIPRRTSTLIPIPVVSTAEDLNNSITHTPPVFLRDEAIDLTTHLAMLRNNTTPIIDKRKSQQDSTKSEINDINTSKSDGRSMKSGATTARSENDYENENENGFGDFDVGFVRLDDPVPTRRDSTISLCLSARSIDDEFNAPEISPDAVLIFGDIEL